MKGKRIYWLFLLPSLCGVLLFFAVPFVFSLYYAVIDNMGSRQFIGLRHFIDTLQNSLFLSAGRNTLVFLLLSVTLSMVLSLLLALALRRLRRGRALAVSLLLLPMVVPSGTIVQFWRVLFDSNGLLCKLLLQMGFGHTWVVQNQWQMGIIVVVFLWKNVSYNTVLFWSGLNWIPRNYYEQMGLEGAGALQQFRQVTWTYLGPTSFIVLLMSIVNSFKVFKEIQMLYGAYPPGGIYMLQHYMNNQFQSLNMQKLSSAAWLLFLVLGLLLAFLFRRQKRLTDLYE